MIFCDFLAYYGYLFPDNSEAAFSNYRLWESLGFILAFGYGNFVRTDIKLYITFSILLVGMFLYGVTEYLERQNRKSANASEKTKLWEIFSRTAWIYCSTILNLLFGAVLAVAFNKSPFYRFFKCCILTYQRQMLKWAFLIYLLFSVKEGNKNWLKNHKSCSELHKWFSPEIKTEPHFDMGLNRKIYLRNKFQFIILKPFSCK